MQDVLGTRKGRRMVRRPLEVEELVVVPFNGKGESVLTVE
jgi:hypothetical protein